MKKVFAGWYAKTPDELKALWETAIIVPDANILLHLLRHSPVVRGQLMEVFDRKKDALWIPYQAGAEFQRRRLDVQQKALDAYDAVVKDLTTFANQARNTLNQYRAHPVIEADREISAIDAFQKEFETRLAAAKAKHPTEEFAKSFERVTELFAGKVGAKPTAEGIAAIYKEGEERYTKKIPPGFEDAKKTGDGDKFGDLIIWKEMMEKAKSEKRPIIFVTDDGKADWWYIHHGRKVGPHPALVEEFLECTGQQFHIYELLQFLRYAADTGSGIKNEAVDHIAEALVADSTFEASVSATDRARVLKVLRTELRGKEFELDGLIKSLIELPPTTSEAVSREDAKRSFKTKIADLTENVRALRDQLAALEDAPENPVTRE